MAEDTITEWWICTGPARLGGERLDGPHGSQDAASTRRAVLEAMRGREDLWTLEASDPDCPGPGDG